MIVERQCERSGKESPCLCHFRIYEGPGPLKTAVLYPWGMVQDMPIRAWHIRSKPDYGLDVKATSHIYEPHHNRASLQNGWPTRWKSMGWRASCMRPMCPWCDWVCATYSWRAIIWTPRCSSSTIACFTVTTLASLRTPGSALLPRRGRKKLKRMKNMWGPPVATHSWPSGSMSGCPLRATTRTRQRESAGRRCQWQHPTFANARFLSASPWDQYAGASAGHTQGPHLGEYPYTRLAEGQVLGPTTHLQIRGVVQGGHWNPYMAGFYEDAGDVADPQVSLISSYLSHLVLIPTSLLCWYLLNGLVVTHLYLLMQDDSRWGFKSLAGDCAQKRRDTQRDPPQALARELAKLLMTSLYGKSPARPSAPTVSGTWDLCCPHLNLSWTQRTCLGTASSIRMMSLRQKWRITTSWLWHKNVWPCTCPSRSPSLCMAMYTVHGHW